MKTTLTDRTDDPIIISLKSELELLRYQLVRLAIRSLPQETDLYNALICRCETKAQFYQWQHDAIAAVIGIAAPDAQGRAHCPLCKEGRQSWGSYDDVGYAVPDGLKRHLLGEGKSAQCSILKVVFDLAQDRMRPKFDEEERREHEANNARRRTERLYQIDPSSPAKLIDDLHSLRGARNPEQLKWAETRLRMLGFESDLSGNVMTYRLPHAEFIILADPRELGTIEVRIYPCTPTGKPSRLAAWTRFPLPDPWKNDLPVKFKKLLEDAIISLPSRRGVRR